MSSGCDGNLLQASGSSIGDWGDASRCSGTENSGGPTLFGNMSSGVGNFEPRHVLPTRATLHTLSSTDGIKDAIHTAGSSSLHDLSSTGDPGIHAQDAEMSRENIDETEMHRKFKRRRTSLSQK